MKEWFFLSNNLILVLKENFEKREIYPIVFELSQLNFEIA